ncbi:helix-turn-helix domain-containing protein [Bacillus cereus]|uniref:helix-turn-helix domain-containing protein n=1 Tax=Bacillus cereus TaxID=1396 RepID=UPI003C12FF0E
MNAAIHYQDGSESIKDIAKSLRANHDVVRICIKQFEYHGIRAFEKGYTTYFVQYKLGLPNYMFENGTSPNETAVIFNISSSGLIRKWRIQLRQKGVDALKSKKKGRQSMTKDNQKSIKKERKKERNKHKQKSQ